MTSSNRVRGRDPPAGLAAERFEPLRAWRSCRKGSIGKSPGTRGRSGRRPPSRFCQRNHVRRDGPRPPVGRNRSARCDQWGAGSEPIEHQAGGRPLSSAELAQPPLKKRAVMDAGTARPAHLALQRVRSGMGPAVLRGRPPFLTASRVAKRTFGPKTKPSNRRPKGFEVFRRAGGTAPQGVASVSPLKHAATRRR